MNLKKSLILGVCAAALAAFAAFAQSDSPIISKGADSALDAMMKNHGRQFYSFNAYPFGLSLDVIPKDKESADLITQFLAQTESEDVKAVTGKHPYELISYFGEHGDLGFFGGVALVGTAYEYLTLKREGAPADELKTARDRVVRAAKSWHVFKVVTGGNGLVARGVRRLVPENPNDPPVPGEPTETMPLFDKDGVPLPQPKSNGTERADNSNGELPAGVWSWIDSASKDQLVGQIFAMVSLYDAMKGDPDIDQSLVEQLSADARLIAGMLMKKREVSQLPGLAGEGEYDLIIMDADGRATKYSDLNPYSIESFYLNQEGKTFNKFNLIMAMGIMKGLYHMAGDAEIERYYYNELLSARGYLDMVLRTAGATDYIYMGVNTNYDDPDLISVALWLNIYLEKDKAVADVMRRFLEEFWWDRPNEPHSAKNCKQPLWHAVYMTLTDRGVSGALVAEFVDLLKGFKLGPYWEEERINCDEAEIAAKRCLAIDGKTVIYLEGPRSDKKYQSKEALHPSIRPTSNFNARSNPFDVNGGGGLTLNPGGDLLASYWIARYMKATAPGEVNVSPFARAHIPVGGNVEPEEENEGGDADMETQSEIAGKKSSGGCAAGCVEWLAAAAIAGLAAARRRF